MNKYFKSMASEAVMECLEHLYEIEKTMDRKYGKGEIRKYVNRGLLDKFDKQEDALLRAVESRDEDKILKLGPAMVRAWIAVDNDAQTNKAPNVDIDVWETKHPLYPDITIYVSKTKFTRRDKKGEVWVSIDELTPFLTPTILAIKEKFQGSDIKGFHDDECPF